MDSALQRQFIAPNPPQFKPPVFTNTISGCEELCYVIVSVLLSRNDPSSFSSPRCVLFCFVSIRSENSWLIYLSPAILSKCSIHVWQFFRFVFSTSLNGPEAKQKSSWKRS